MKLQRPTSRTLILVGVISIVVGALLIEMIAIAKRWDGLAREISFLVAFPALPLAIMAAFPHTVHHIRAALYVMACLVVLLTAIFLIRIAWLTRQESVIKIAVSLPFSIDRADARPIYDGVKTALGHMSGDGVRQIDDHTLEMSHHIIQLVPFDDSAIGDRDCRGAHPCPITLPPGGKQEDFTVSGWSPAATIAVS